MTSPGIHTSRADLVNRLSVVLQASRTIRSEVALTICESSEMRLASRQLRVASEQLRQDSSRTAAGSAACRRRPQARKTERIPGIAEAIAQILSSQGYSAFVMSQDQETASIQ